MFICGTENVSLVDYNEKIATVVFTAGCNMRCPFCHNAELVLCSDKDYRIDEKEVFDFLEKRKSLIDAVVVSGGEPTLQKDLARFIADIKATGRAVKLDTNGLRPEVLEKLFADNLLDYVAMDIKNSRQKYSMTAGVNIDTDIIMRSIKLIEDNAPDYEFRTTVIKEFHTEDDFEDIAEMLAGAKRYYIQKYKDADTCFQHGFHAPDYDAAVRFKDIVSRTVKSVHLRGF